MTVETISWVDPDGTVTALPPQLLRGVQGRGLPPVQITAEAAIGRPGTQVRNVRFGARRVSIPILLQGLDTTVRTELRDWARRLDPTRGVGILRVQTMVGDVRELRCRYIGGLEIVEGVSWIQQATVEFDAADPMWLGPVQTATSIWSVPASTFFPLLPLRLVDQLAPVSIDNTGDELVLPTIRVTGPCDAFTIGAGSSRLEVPVVLGPGEQRIIDCDRRTMVDGAGFDRWRELVRVGEWPAIPARTVGLVRFGVIRPQVGMQVQVDWRTRHLTS